MSLSLVGYAICLDLLGKPSIPTVEKDRKVELYEDLSHFRGDGTLSNILGNQSALAFYFHIPLHIAELC